MSNSRNAFDYHTAITDFLTKNPSLMLVNSWGGITQREGKEAAKIPLTGTLAGFKAEELAEALSNLEKEGKVLCERRGELGCTNEMCYTLSPEPVKVAA